MEKDKSQNLEIVVDEKKLEETNSLAKKPIEWKSLLVMAGFALLLAVFVYLNTKK